MSRWLRFLVAILVGVGLGLAYGWLVSPVEYVDTTPETLHLQYKTDYVLMTAEAYKADGDLPQAVRRLGMLGSVPPAEQVYQGILFAQKVGYADADLELMQALFTAVQAFNLIQETPIP